jgi:hypothetical protein
MGRIIKCSAVESLVRRQTRMELVIEMAGSIRGKELVERVRKAKTDFGDYYPKKFGGAAAIEILRVALREERIETSRRDVFIRGIPLEVDLIVPRKGAKPWLDLLYEPQHVVVALEVKKYGVYGEKARDKLKKNFASLWKKGVNCAYITFEDRESYLWRPKEEFLGFPCFALAWTERDNGELKSTKEDENWEAFVKYLREEITKDKGDASEWH